MEERKRTFIHQGKEITATFLEPKDLAQAINVLGEVDVFKTFLEGYWMRQKSIALGRKPRIKKWLKLDTTKLDPDQIKVLQTFKLL